MIDKFVNLEGSCALVVILVVAVHLCSHIFCDASHTAETMDREVWDWIVCCL